VTLIFQLRIGLGGEAGWNLERSGVFNPRNISAARLRSFNVDKEGLKAAIIDSGYWPASDFTGLP
jgi:hypothetical protein